MKQQVQQPVIDPMTGEPVVDPMTGMPQMETKEVDVPVEITAEQLDEIKPLTRIDVTKDNSFTREAQQQVIDGLLEKGLISLEEWRELATDTSPVPKHALEVILERRKVEQQNQPPMQPMAQPMQ
jgi:polyhydroxyalkanoate synthesis regulator phasin